MDVGSGTDTSELSAASGDRRSVSGGDPLLAGVRRLTLLADGAEDSEAIFRALARELQTLPGAEEIYVHHLRGLSGERIQRMESSGRSMCHSDGHRAVQPYHG